MLAENYALLDDVYGTTRHLPLSYVSRHSVDDRFVTDLTRKKHIVLSGSSKQGKSSVRKSCLKPEDAIVVQCGRDTLKPALYEMILKQAKITTTVSEQKTLKGEFKLTAEIKVEGKIPLLASGETTGGGEGGLSYEQQQAVKQFDVDPSDPNDIARILIEASFNKFIILEDFHYLDEEVQQSLAFDLKVFYEVSNLVFIIVGVWLESNRLTMYNGDLAGRISPINADEWAPQQLNEVIVTGEKLLNICFSDSLKAAIVDGCQGNVGVLQEVCHRVCSSAGVYKTSDALILIDTLELAHLALKDIAQSEGGRYKTFLSKFSLGLGATELEIYKWIAWAAVTSKPAALRSGLAPRIIFQMIKKVHPSDTLQQNNVSQALERVLKVQAKHKLQPLIFDFSDGELKVVDGNFLVYVQAANRQEVLEAIGMDTVPIDFGQENPELPHVAV